MAALTKIQKFFIVERLAMFESPQEVAKAFQEEFGRDVARQQVWSYDASKPQNRGQMSCELVGLFDSVRKRFQEEILDIPIANRSYRLRELQKQLERAKGKKYPDEARISDALEQAAKEEGGAFTNRRELTGAGGGPVRFLSEIDDEELDRRIASAEGGKAPAAVPQEP
jgi:hypothetical protein